MGQYEKARASYEKSIALRPNSPVAINNLGNAFLKLKLLDVAIQAFDRALKLKPDYIDAIYNRANAFLFGPLDLAVQGFERVIREKPLYALAFNGRGLALLELKRFDEALADFNQALRLKPDLGQAMANRARTLVETGDVHGGLETYRKVGAIAPELEAALLGEARLLVSSGYLSEALDNCRRAMRNDPRSIEAMTILGQCVGHEGKIAEALELYDQVLAVQPDHEGQPPPGNIRTGFRCAHRIFRTPGTAQDLVGADRLEGSQDCRSGSSKRPHGRPPADGRLCVCRFQGSLCRFGVRPRAAQSRQGGDRGHLLFEHEYARCRHRRIRARRRQMGRCLAVARRQACRTYRCRPGR